MSEPTQQTPGESYRLQQFGLKDSTYERPNQDWVCGHLSEGAPCAIGPSARGRCLATTECRPLKKGDRWNCTRRDISGASSPCDEGPLPDGSCCRPIARCAPVRSIRGQRARCALGAFALSAGVLSFLLLGPARSEFVKPGDLTDAHAQVLKAQKVEDCEHCHESGNGDARQWLRLALAPVAGAVQNEKCLVCHQQVLGDNAALPHSLPAAKLASISAKVQATGPRTREQILASFASPAPTTPGGELACATCHQEHGGRRLNLKSLPDISCQTCHKMQFQSFAHGHPEFKAVRHDQAGIIFNHFAHKPLMPDGKLECSRCHRQDPVGRTMLVTTFEQSCSGCHNGPEIDNHGNEIRKDTRVILSLKSPSPVTPFFQYLIAGDESPKVRDALHALCADPVLKGSIDEMDEGDQKTLLTSAVEQVKKELVSGNDKLLRVRIARAAGVPPESPAVAALVEQLSGAGNLATAWQHRAGPATAPAKASDGLTEWKNDASAWFVDTVNLSVDYRPSHADSFDKSWIDLLSSHAKPSKGIVDKMTDGDFVAALRFQLLNNTYLSSCLKCHQVQAGDDSNVVNWRAAGHVTRVAGYVTFDHRPHLTLVPGEDKCSNCHKLEASVPAQGSQPVAAVGFHGSEHLNHNFAAHEKQTCAECHTPSGAPDSCLTCHKYHMKR